MPGTIRFPYPTTTKGRGQPAEANQIIVLATAITQFTKGGETTYADIRPWKLDVSGTEAPYDCVVIEFTATGAAVLGDGDAEAIGVFGELDGIGKFLLGLVGISLGDTYPQIPIIAADIGTAIPVSKIALYDRLSIGGVFGDIPFEEGIEVTVTARPIHHHVYVG